jgi:ribosomal-protein-alanine N-acetyltransferase
VILSDYNVAYSRRRFLQPVISDPEIRELLQLEKLCFPPPDNYDTRTLRMFLSLNGSGLLRWRQNEHSPVVAFHLFNCLAGELITLDVHPEFRNRGIGSELLKKSLGKLREMSHPVAHCQISVNNAASLALHRKFGFQIRKILKNYYGPGRNAYLLSAMLTAE